MRRFKISSYYHIICQIYQLFSQGVLEVFAEAYAGLCQTYIVELFVKRVSGSKPLTIFSRKHHDSCLRRTKTYFSFISHSSQIIKFLGMEKHNSNSQTSKKYDLQNQRQTEMLATAFFFSFCMFFKKTYFIQTNSTRYQLLGCIMQRLNFSLTSKI